MDCHSSFIWQARQMLCGDFILVSISLLYNYKLSIMFKLDTDKSQEKPSNRKCKRHKRNRGLSLFEFIAHQPCHVETLYCTEIRDPWNRALHLNHSYWIHFLLRILTSCCWNWIGRYGTRDSIFLSVYWVEYKQHTFVLAMYIAL